MEMEAERYHYIESGLDNVWLYNGYTTDQDEDFEHLVSLVDVNGLHRSIAKTLLMKSAPLFGNEFKFLRTHCNVSQEAVANAIEITDEDVLRIEERIDKPLDIWGKDMLFRVYISSLIGDEIFSQTIGANLRDLGRKTPVAERVIMRKADEWNSEVLSY